MKRKLDSVHFSKVVKLNVGGELFQTSLDTLLLEPRSFFGAMFSGAWETNADENGAYFIDRYCSKPAPSNKKQFGVVC
jgi:hypothetical protein